MNIFSLQCCFTKTIKKEQRHQDNFHRPSAEYWRQNYREALQGAQAFTARALRQGLMWRNKRKTEDGAAHRNERSVRLAKFKCLGPAPLLCRGESRTAVYGTDSRKVFRDARGKHIGTQSSAPI